MCGDIAAHMGKLHLNPYCLSVGVPMPAAVMALGEIYLWKRTEQMMDMSSGLFVKFRKLSVGPSLG